MRAKKRKVTKGTYGVEVDGKEYQVEGKRVEKRGGRVTKFKAKGEGDGFKIKINDKLKKTNVFTRRYKSQKRKVKDKSPLRTILLNIDKDKFQQIANTSNIPERAR